MVVFGVEREVSLAYHDIYITTALFLCNSKENLHKGEQGQHFYSGQSKKIIVKKISM